MTKPQQVLFLLPTLGGGGAERVMVTLLRHLDRSKVRLALVVVDNREAAYRGDVPQDVEFIDLNCSRVRYALPKIFGLIRRRRPDVVFSTLGHLNLALALMRPFLPNGVRYVARESVFVSEGIRLYAWPALWRWAYRRLYGRFDSVVCQSFAMRDDLVSNFALAAEKALVIYNPLDVGRIKELAARPATTGMAHAAGDGTQIINLVAAGRLLEQKGFDLLIDAVALCSDPRLRLTIVGEGPLKDRLQMQAAEKGVARQVRFAGFQANPYPFFAQADAFVLSSRFEGIPNVVLEALACGAPVIATPAPGGVREILEGRDGCLLAEEVTERHLANAIRTFCRQTTSRPLSVGDLARFSIAEIVSRYQQVLVCEASGPSAPSLNCESG